MSDDDKMMAMFVAKIDELQRARRALDEQIAALSMTYELMSGKTPPGAQAGSAPAHARRPRRGAGIVRDQQGVAKTLDFLKARGKPTSVAMVARHFRIGNPAATQRCIRLLRLGSIRRVQRSIYEAV